jgi:hypothetical protein
MSCCYGKRYNGYTQKPIVIKCCYEEPVSISREGAIPESMRLASRQCEMYVGRKLASDSVCAASTNPGVHVIVTSQMSDYAVPTSIPRSSDRTALLREQSLQTSTDITNPETRFSQYFPARPPTPPCPERLPNKDPPQPTRPCVGVGRFAGSKLE